jgi:hypothetical protein
MPSRGMTANTDPVVPESDQTTEQPVALQFPFDTEAEEPSVAATVAIQDDIPAPAYQPQVAEPEPFIEPETEASSGFCSNASRNAYSRSYGSAACGCCACSRGDRSSAVRCTSFFREARLRRLKANLV